MRKASLMYYKHITVGQPNFWPEINTTTNPNLYQKTITGLKKLQNSNQIVILKSEGYVVCVFFTHTQHTYIHKYFIMYIVQIWNHILKIKAQSSHAHRLMIWCATADLITNDQQHHRHAGVSFGKWPIRHWHQILESKKKNKLTKCWKKCLASLNF